MKVKERDVTEGGHRDPAGRAGTKRQRRTLASEQYRSVGRTAGPLAMPLTEQDSVRRSTSNQPSIRISAVQPFPHPMNGDNGPISPRSGTCCTLKSTLLHTIVLQGVVFENSLGRSLIDNGRISAHRMMLKQSTADGTASEYADYRLLTS